MRRRIRLFPRRRWLVSGVIPILALLVLGGGVLAGGWCRADPIVELEGEEVQIWVAIPDQHQSKVNGPIDVEIAVPDGVSTEVTFLDAGFNGHGETVTFVEGGKGRPDKFEAHISVSIPLDNPNLAIPAEVEVIHAGTSEFFSGTSSLTFAKVKVNP